MKPEVGFATFDSWGPRVLFIIIFTHFCHYYGLLYCFCFDVTANDNLSLVFRRILFGCD